jgi:hypothetical protein
MLRLLESFDMYGTVGATGPTLNDDIARRHNGGSLLNGVDGDLIDGRGDGLGLRFNYHTNNKVYLTRYDPSQSDTWIVGFAYKTPLELNFTTNFIWESYSGQLYLSLKNSGLFVSGTGWSTAEPVDHVINPNRWYYIEIKVYHHASAGTVEVRINGVTAYTATNKDTLNGSVEAGGAFVLYAPEDDSAYDDIYVCDDTGSTNNDFLGPQKVETLRPSGDDGVQNWTPSAGGSHAGLVDNPDMWDPTEYVEATGANVDDLWTYPTTSFATINGVQLITSAWTDTGLPLTLQAICDSGSTIDYSASHGMGAEVTPLPHEVVWESDPDTSSPWTPAGLNAASFGIRKV